MAMVFELVEYVKDCLTDHNRPHGQCALCQCVFEVSCALWLCVFVCLVPVCV